MVPHSKDSSGWRHQDFGVRWLVCAFPILHWLLAPDHWLL